MAKKKYFVTFRIDARFVTEVEADSIEAAKEAAESNYMDANFGELEDIVDDECIIVEDADGNIVFEK